MQTDDEFVVLYDGGESISFVDRFSAERRSFADSDEMSETR